jgi:hypothetical protein
MHMEIVVSQTQLDVSAGLIAAAVERLPSEAEGRVFTPDQTEVPRPNFAGFNLHLQAQAEASGAPLARHNGRLAVTPQQSTFLEPFEGLRGFGTVATLDSNGRRQFITGPAIVLNGGQDIAMLTAEAPSGVITDMQHSLLEVEYVKHLAQVTPEHSQADVTNAGDIGPSLVVASSTLTSNAHGDLHGLAGNGRQTTFGSNFSHAQRQDIQVGQNTRHVRSRVVPLSNAVMAIGEHDQLPASQKLFNVALSSGELAVSLTLAAAQSRTDLSDAAHAAMLRRNFSAMVTA